MKHWFERLKLSRQLALVSCLAIYPEREEALLFGQRRYRWYASQAVVKPRAKRYHVTSNGLRQYDALDEESKAGSSRKWATAGDGQAVSTLMEKLLLLCAVKTATLDAAGMGVEMEGGQARLVRRPHNYTQRLKYLQLSPPRLRRGGRQQEQKSSAN